MSWPGVSTDEAASIGAEELPLTTTLLGTAPAEAGALELGVRVTLCPAGHGADRGPIGAMSKPWIFFVMLAGFAVPVLVRMSLGAIDRK